jgi:hypothetical protein
LRPAMIAFDRGLLEGASDIWAARDGRPYAAISEDKHAGQCGARSCDSVCTVSEAPLSLVHSQVRRRAAAKRANLLSNFATPTGIEDQVNCASEHEPPRIDGVGDPTRDPPPPYKHAKGRRSEASDCGPDASVDLIRARELVAAAASLAAPGGPCAVLLAEALAALNPQVPSNVLPLRRRR